MSTRRHTILIGSTLLLATAAIYVAVQSRGTPLAPSAPGGSSLAEKPNPMESAALAKRARQRAQIMGTPRRRENPAYKVDLDNSKLAQEFDSYMDRARIDPVFAYAFGVALAQCAKADSSYALLERHAADPSFKYKESLGPTLADYDRDFAKCKGLTADQTLSHLELVTRAANAGVLEAQFNYVQLASDLVNSGAAVRTPNLADEIRTNAEAFTLAAASTGDPRALHAAYRFYRYGYLVPRDNLRAYNYYSAYAQAQPSSMSATVLAQLRAQLTAEELRRAQ